MTLYRTTVPVPDARFHGVSDADVLAEFLDKCREVSYPQILQTASGPEVVLEFEAVDTYELAVTVRDLQDELQAAGYHQGILDIARPRRVRAPRRTAA